MNMVAWVLQIVLAVAFLLHGLLNWQLQSVSQCRRLLTSLPGWHPWPRQGSCWSWWARRSSMPGRASFRRLQSQC